MSAPAIEVEGLTRSFGAVRALRGLRFTVPAGRVVGLLGPNGAGKTTTLRILLGLLAPDAGRVRVLGREPLAAGATLRRRIGFLPENNPLDRRLRVRRQLALFAEFYGVPASTVAEVAARCGVDAVLDRTVGELSKGYRQRVGLAAALLPAPHLLILDEPASGLDPNQVIELRGLVRSLARAPSGGDPGCTVLLSSHVLAEVEHTVDEVVIMARGLVVESGTPADIKRRVLPPPALEVELAEAGSDALRRALEALPGVRSIETPAPDRWLLLTGDEDPRAAVARCCAEAGVPAVGIQRREARLEQAFAQLTA